MSALSGKRNQIRMNEAEMSIYLNMKCPNLSSVPVLEGCEIFQSFAPCGMPPRRMMKIANTSRNLWGKMVPAPMMMMAAANLLMMEYLRIEE